MTLNEFLKSGNPEQIEKLMACKTTEDMLILAKELGIPLRELEDGEITDNELEAISGGGSLGFIDTHELNPYWKPERR